MSLELTEGQLGQLSTREKAVLKLAAAGLTDAAIARKLGIARSTVLTYWVRIRAKLGNHSRTELAVAFVRVVPGSPDSSIREELQALERAVLQMRERIDEIRHELEAKHDESTGDDAEMPGDTQPSPRKDTGAA